MSNRAAYVHLPSLPASNIGNEPSVTGWQAFLRALLLTLSNGFL